jgi:hypothetical protein
MKIKFGKSFNFIAFSSGLLAVVILASCAFPFQSPEEASLQDISGELVYMEISRQGFMGGSILYNPDNPASGHLAEKAVVAVRLGYLEAEPAGNDRYFYSDIQERRSMGRCRL